MSRHQNFTLELEHRVWVWLAGLGCTAWQTHLWSLRKSKMVSMLHSCCMLFLQIPALVFISDKPHKRCRRRTPACGFSRKTMTRKPRAARSGPAPRAAAERTKRTRFRLLNRGEAKRWSGLCVRCLVEFFLFFCTCIMCWCFLTERKTFCWTVVCCQMPLNQT